MMNSICCCGDGRKQRAATAKWYCSPARPVSANRGSPSRFLSASLTGRDAGSLRHLLDEQGDTIGSLDDVLPDAGGQWLLPDDAINHRADVTLSQSIDGEECHIRSPYPGSVKFRPKCHDQQRRKGANPIDDPTKRFQARASISIPGLVLDRRRQP